MKILYITNKPIYPKIDGGCVAMANFLETLLYKNCIIHHITISTHKHPFQQSKYPRTIQEKIQLSSVELDTRIKPLNALKSFFTKGAYHIERFYSSELIEDIKKTISIESFDCIVLDSLYSSAHLDEIKNLFSGKIFIRTHNVENQIWKDLSKNEKNPFKKIILSKLTKDLRKYEINTLNKVNGVLCISKDDSTIFRQIGVSTKMEVVSVSIPKNNIENDYNSNNLFHIGAMNWKPNEEAVNRLIQLLPEISTQTSAQLHLAGSHFSENIKPSENIRIHGFIEDIFEFAISCGILVTPIISGSGVRIKILEMMSAGIPIITTQKGAEGIDYQNNDCLIIAETDEEIIAKSIFLIKNKAQRMKIGKKSRSYIPKFHSIEKISQQLFEFIREQ